jgi:hypothetical protein
MQRMTGDRNGGGRVLLFQLLDVSAMGILRFGWKG